MKKYKKLIAVFLAMVLTLAAVPAVAVAAETENEPVVVKDTEEERIAELTEEEVIYRAVFDKTENTITVYTIRQNEVVETKVVDLSAPLVSSWAMSRTGDIILSQTGFGYSLGLQANEYGGPYSVSQKYGFTYGGFRLGRDIESGLQQELRQCIDRMLVLEGSLQVYLEASEFIGVMSLVPLYCFDLSGAFSTAVASYTTEVEARVTANEIHTQATIAAPKFAILYVTAYPNEAYKLAGE